MIFGNKRKIPDVTISMYGCPLGRVKEFKFLGLWLDERLGRLGDMEFPHR